MPVLDVVVHHLKGDTTGPNDAPESERPPEVRFLLSERLWVGKLPEDTARRIFETCTPQPYGFPRPKAPFQQIYAYAKEIPPPFSLSKERWDDDGKLQTLVALSRLIHPTSASLRLVARIELDLSGKTQWIYPARLEGVQQDAFVDPTNRRDWLTTLELQNLRAISKFVDRPALPDRLWKAFWYHEYAARSYDLDLRWPLIATGLEALIHTDTRNTGAQFRHRTSALAKELGVTDFGNDDASKAWDMRSGLAHGQNLGTLSDANLRLYVSMESVLWLALLKAVRDPRFSAVFRDDSAIHLRWPLP